MLSDTILAGCSPTRLQDELRRSGGSRYRHCVEDPGARLGADDVAACDCHIQGFRDFDIPGIWSGNAGGVEAVIGSTERSFPTKEAGRIEFVGRVEDTAVLLQDANNLLDDSFVLPFSLVTVALRCTGAASTANMLAVVVSGHDYP